MNNSFIFTVITWKTRSAAKIIKAKEYCKRYGLCLLMNNCYVGKLKPKEQKQIKLWFQENFFNKTENFYLFSLCKSCYKESILYKNKKNVIEHKNFEII